MMKTAFYIHSYIPFIFYSFIYSFSEIIHSFIHSILDQCISKTIWTMTIALNRFGHNFQHSMSVVIHITHIFTILSFFDILSKGQGKDTTRMKQAPYDVCFYIHYQYKILKNDFKQN